MYLLAPFHPHALAPNQFNTPPTPIMAIKESLKTFHLSPARTVGDGSYSWRKGGLAGLSLSWCWVFSTRKTDHTGGSPDPPDGSGIRTNVRRSFKSSFFRLPICLLHFLLHPQLQLSPFQYLTIKTRGVKDRVVTFFSQAAPQMQIQT